MSPAKTFLIAFGTVVLAAMVGCETGGYSKLDGEWCYVVLGGIGDKPKPRKLHADNDTFQVYSRHGYAKDKDCVFFKGRKVENGDANSFHVEENDYARDANHVYLRGVIVQRANPASFRQLEYPYGRDEKLAFCGTLPMTVDNIDRFRVTKTSENVHSSLAGFDSIGYLDNYHEELDPNIDLVYGVKCRARTDHQRFQGPIRIE